MIIPVSSGGGKIYAVIGVTYPAGSTCSATLGGRTLRAPDTSGQWACVVPGPGAWTVSCTDGSKSKAETVEISAPGQVELATLSYELTILDGATGASSSLWRVDQLGSGKISYTAAGIVVDPQGYVPKLRTVNTVDLTPYSTLTFAMSRPTNTMRIRCGVGMPNGDYGYITNWQAYTDTESTDADIVLAVNVAEIGQTYVGMELTYGTKCTFSRIVAS